MAQRAVVDAILTKHDAATDHRRFNAILATASINDAIDYHELFKQAQAERRAQDPNFIPLHIACVFSPPLALMEELVPLLKKQAGGREISGLAAYE